MSTYIELYEDDDPQQVQYLNAWQDDPEAAYAGAAVRLDTESLMRIVGERLGASQALRGIIEDIQRAPFTGHDRLALHVSDSMRLGDAAATFIAAAMDELIEMQAAYQERQ